MGKLLEKLEDIFTAVSFAEAGEHETAIEMAKGPGDNGPDQPKSRGGIYVVRFCLAEDE